MNKNEFELQKLTIGARRLDRVLAFGAFIAKLILIAFLGYWLFDTLKVLGAMHPASLEALSKVVEKLSLGTIAHSILTASLATAWWIERKGKKRAIHKVSDLRKQVEHGDAYHASSDLDKDGHTPSKSS